MFDKAISENIEDQKGSEAVPAKNIAMRQEIGAYYTPLHVAKILSNWAIRDGDESILEPCFGGCDFLEAIHARFLQCNQINFESRIFGCDIDPDAFSHLSNRMNDATFSGNFLRADFLSVTSKDFNGQKFSCVIGNPPYIKNERFSESQRDSIARLPSDLHSWVKGKANLWAYFIMHAMSFLAPGGRMAWVLPGNFLSADYSVKLKMELANRFELVTAISVSERLFLNQGTEERTVVLLCDGYGKKGGCDLNVKYCADANELIYLLEPRNSFCDQGDDSLTEYSQMTKEQARIFLEVTEKVGARKLSEFGAVHIGIVLGDKKFFVRSISEWKKTKISKSYIVPIVSKFSFLNGLQLKRSDIELWKKNDRVCFFLNTRGKRLGSRLLHYLLPRDVSRSQKNCTFERREIWHQPDDGQICDAFIASLNHNGPRIVLNTEKLQATNSLYRFDFDKVIDDAQRQMIVISIHSTLSQLSAELVGRQLGSGALKLEPKEVLQILVAVNLQKSKREISTAFNRIDELLREGQFQDARYVADAFLFDGLVTDQEITILRAALNRVRQHRLRSKASMLD